LLKIVVTGVVADTVGITIGVVSEGVVGVEVVGIEIVDPVPAPEDLLVDVGIFKN
jgi:hypothetical protein